MLLGTGDGTFQSPVTFAAGPGPFYLVAGDFNGDGRLDLAVATEDPNDVSVLMGNGDGMFQPARTVAAGIGGPLVAGDFNGDDKLDLAVSGTAEGTDGGFSVETGEISVLLGNGDGTFQPATEYAVGTSAEGLVAVDVNGDGKFDVAVADPSSNEISVLMGTSDGTFVDPGQLAVTPQATPLVADVNGDGTSDVLVVDGAGNILYRQGIPGQPGTFEPPVTVNPNNPSRDIAFVTNTIDGPLLASVDAHDDAISLYAWRDGGLIRIGSLTTGQLPAQIIAADLNGNGWDDLVVRNAGDGTLSVFFAKTFTGPIDPELDFETFLPPVTLSVGPGVSDVQAVDTTGSGRLDLVVTNKLTGQVSILLNLGDGTFAPPVPYRAGTGLSAIDPGSTPEVTSLEATAGVAAGAFTTGGPTDLVTINPGSNTLDVLAGLGGGRFANPVAIQTQGPAQVVRVADFMGNGIDDLAVLTTSGVRHLPGQWSGGLFASDHLRGAVRIRWADRGRPDRQWQTRPSGRRRLRRCPGAAWQWQRHLRALSRGQPGR